MNHTKIMNYTLRILLLTSSLCGVAALADPINITVDSSGNLLHVVGVANKDEYGLNNNNPNSNFEFLGKEVGFWNGAGNSPFMSAPAMANATDFAKDDNLGGGSYSSQAGWDYVVFHFGAGQAAFQEPNVFVPAVIVPPVYFTSGPKKGQIKKAGYTIPGYYIEGKWNKSEGGWWAAFYVGGLGYDFYRPIPGPTPPFNGEPVGGFSSATYFNHHSVPDGGMTILLLGLGLLGIGCGARRFGVAKS